jgi:hypothetical protein
MFVGRGAQLRRLNEMYGSGRFECAIVYGRRRVRNVFFSDWEKALDYIEQLSRDEHELYGGNRRWATRARSTADGRRNSRYCHRKPTSPSHPRPPHPPNNPRRNAIKTPSLFIVHC